MLKSAVIVGILAFVLSIGAALITPLCVPCLALLFGLAAGYLAGLFDKPISNAESVKAGALSGAISGIGAMLGQIVGAVANSLIMGPEGAARVANSFGLPTGSSSSFAASYWVGVVGSTACFSLLDILFMAAIGALGGVLWWQLSGKNSQAVLPAE